MQSLICPQHPHDSAGLSHSLSMRDRVTRWPKLRLGPPPVASGTASGAGVQQVEHHGRFSSGLKELRFDLNLFYVATGWTSSDVRQGKGPHAVLHAVADYLGGRSISRVASLNCLA